MSERSGVRYLIIAVCMLGVVMLLQWQLHNLKVAMFYTSLPGRWRNIPALRQYGGRDRPSLHLTIFTVARGFRGSYTEPEYIIELNAIESWRRAEGVTVDEIIVVVDNLRQCPRLPFASPDSKTKQRNPRGRHITPIRCILPPCTYDNTSIPRLDCVFTAAEDRAPTNDHIMAFINSDILMVPDFGEAISVVSQYLPSFTLVGARRDILWWNPIDFFNKSWPVELEQIVLQQAEIHPLFGIDYFIYTRDRAIPLLPFLVGRWRWDNWLLNKHISTHGMVVDGSEVILAIHQQTREGLNFNHAERPYANVNEELVINESGLAYEGGRLDYVPYVLKGDMCPACTLEARAG
jgi:hypothetical protein